jgi:hypothetical protein
MLACKKKSHLPIPQNSKKINADSDKSSTSSSDNKIYAVPASPHVINNMK